MLCVIVRPSCGDESIDYISQMPTFVVYKNGEKIKELVGANPAGLEVRTLIIRTHLHVTDKSYRNW